ncbi:trimeric intracellular cation channel family protein [soil metagenome]
MPIIANPMAYAAFSYLGVAVFAATGALAAARKDHDVVTFIFFAAVTGVGGGTIRDLLLDVPPFWILDPMPLVISVVVGAAVWLLGHSRWHEPVLLWLDAVGLAAFAVLGAAKSAALGHPAPVSLVMGVLTASAGGIIRDVVAGEPSIMVRREIYVTAATVAAGAFLLLTPFIGQAPAGAIGFVAGLGLRAGALAFGWALPPFTGGLLARLRRP